MTLIRRTTGDSVRSLVYPRVTIGYGIEGASVGLNGTVLATSWWASNVVVANKPDVAMLYSVDTLGNYGFQYNYPAPPDNFVNYGYQSSFPAQLALPNGYLMLFNPDRNEPNRYEDSGWLRLDARGRIRRSYVSNADYSDQLMELRPLPNGSYVALGTTLGAGTNHDLYLGHDHLLYRLRPSGEAIDSTIFGVDGFHERAFNVQPTPDGGLILAGRVNQPNAPLPQRAEQGLLTKLDSAYNIQWQRRIYGADNVPPLLPGCHLFGVQPLANGGYLAMGTIYAEIPQFPGTKAYRGLLVELDASGQEVWRQTFAPPVSPLTVAFELNAGFIDWVYEPNGSVVILGGDGWELSGVGQQADNWVFKLTGLPLPWVPDWCARPPATPALRGPAQEVAPATWRYAADSTTAAGPRYAELSLCTWEWGDGSPVDTGWVAQHQYLTPAPVRVRQCVTNNLFCQSCTEHFPLGPLSAADELAARVTVWPNPSASGGFTLGLGADQAARYEVCDALGRRVAAGEARGAATALDLRAQPAGLYLLRLTMPDGRVVSKRLMR